MATNTGVGIKERLHNRRSQILLIAAKHGADNVRVFGSQIRDRVLREAVAL